MDTNCKKCGQKYHLPDEQLTDRRLYFNCEKCDNKIIIDRRTEGWLSFKGMSVSPMSSKNILEGFYYSFNLKNVLFSFLLLITYSILLAIAAMIAQKNAVYFMSHPALSGFLGFLFFILIIFTYDIHLYLLSKNSFHRINFKGNLQFSSIAPEIQNDIKPVFVISIGLFILFSILFFPVYLMKNAYGLVYEGILHTALLPVIAVVIFLYCFKNIFYAYIAYRVRDARTTFRNIFTFIAVENINIPFYALFINVVSLFMFLFVMYFMISGILVIFSLMLPGLSGSTSFSLSGLISGTAALKGLAGPSETAVSGMSEGILIISISSYLVFLFISSYIINLNQTLSVVSVQIMGDNPGRSISRKAQLVSFILMVCVLILSFLFLYR